MAEPLRKPPAPWEPDVSTPGADPFRYGWRIRHVRQPSGEVVEQQIPLTPEDLLDPQLGDVVVQTGRHYWEAHRVAGLLKDHFASREDAYVAGDMKMLWGIEGLPEPAPDVAVIFGVRNARREPDSFDCVAEGTRPSLVIEVVSSNDAEVRRNDYQRKPEIYEQAGIPEYIILDPPAPFTKNRCLLTGFRLGPEGLYQPMRPDAQGFLLSETTNLCFGVAEDGRTLQVIDVVTGKRLLTSQEAREAGLRAEERAEREAGRAEREAERAEREAGRAEREAGRAEREAEARKAAEAEVARLRAELERTRSS